MSAFYEGLRNLFIGLAEAGTLPEAFQYAFVINSLLCALVIGPLLGCVGTMVVAKRMAFFSQAVGNAALTGVAIGVLIGESYTSPYISMFSFCIAFGILLNYTKGRTKMSSDTLIGVFLSISLALGASLILFVSARVNTHILESVLFGSILTVNDLDMNILLVVTVITLALGIPLYNRMMVSSLNQSLAHVRGIKVDALEYIFVILLTIITVACVKIIGAILVEALLLIPAAAARNISRNLKSFVWMTVLISTLSCIGGILIPMQWDLPLPSGGAIVLVAAIFFILTTSLKGILPVFREARM
ncbi:MAG: zinc ABC transporter permease [Gammaproteobacteria bacterium]|nr:zinc ABC transporter permease [Gammaproteobacteria bacterium]MAY01898.1 zinc ABC transporter permease [Gammaproteobacteria bacterium]|tara:strand:+ start:332898 stop:333803 length:906 start_codon:yes stop_codon:yes gene_type:complete